MARKNNPVLDQLKYEIAQELNVPLDTQTGYNGHLTAAQAGALGGNMVRKMIELAKHKMEESSK